MVYRRRNWGKLYKEAMNMLEKGYLIRDVSKQLNIYRGTIRFWRDGKTTPLEIKIERKVNLLRDKVINRPEFSYLVGIYWGDGYLRDRDFIELFIKAAKRLGFRTGKIRVVKGGVRRTPSSHLSYCQDIFVVTISSKVLSSLILSSTDKKLDKFPEFLLSSSPECKSSFLRGLFDSDGSISFGFYKYKDREKYPNLQKKIYLCNKNHEFLLFVKEILNNLRIRTKIRKAEGAYNLTISGVAYNIIKFAKTVGFSIRRKQAKLSQLIQIMSEQRQTKHTPEQYFKALKLKKQGFGAAEVAKVLGLNQFTVYDWLYRNRKPRTVETHS